jgi:hypothetical protein
MRVVRTNPLLLALTLPPLVHLLMAMNGKINLGLRHVIVIYPFLYICWALMNHSANQQTKKYQLACCSGHVSSGKFNTDLPHYLSYSMN